MVLSVLLIDTDLSEMAMVRRILEKLAGSQFRLVSTHTVEDAVDILWEQTFDLILLNQNLDSGSAILDAPYVIKAHIKSRAKLLVSQSPSPKKTDSPSNADDDFIVMDKYGLYKALPSIIFRKNAGWPPTLKE